MNPLPFRVAIPLLVALPNIAVCYWGYFHAGGYWPAMVFLGEFILAFPFLVIESALRKLAAMPGHSAAELYLRLCVFGTLTLISIGAFAGYAIDRAKR